GREMDEYSRTRDLLLEYSKRMNVSIIYVIMVDRSDYGSFVSIFDVVNNEVDDSNYAEWELGHKRDVTNTEYIRKYKMIYENGSKKETIYQPDPKEGLNPYITTLVPVKDSGGNVAGILCIQRPIREVWANLIPYITGVIIITGALAFTASFHTSSLIGKRVLIPITKISKEAIRFAGDRKVAKPLGNVSSYTELAGLAASIDSMEQDIVGYMEDLTEVTAEKERINTELSLAAGIQESALPNTWPAFPERDEFSIYAVMAPAKKVGGDFFDFFLIDDDHLYMTIADVSDKGIPASLFMMSSRIILSDHAAMGKSPSRILNDCNNALCANNKEMMFVTVWVGILEISTGILKCSNAGHKPPIIRHGAGEYKPLSDDHSMCLGIISDMEYPDYEIKLEPGSVLFVYTDGLEDATDADENMFGTERILSVLNNEPDNDPVKILTGMSEQVDRFSGNTEQFDDLTMLCLSIRGDGSL
ncbi:MAG: SpoIIE family protein phosphatase, partial [Lachnospiraceae bacterium]|nr:SpoIIE family protein phosphatase [Lachnospiraceae bacterium]